MARFNPGPNYWKTKNHGWITPCAPWLLPVRTGQPGLSPKGGADNSTAGADPGICR